jgi:hypothetical protein
LVVLLFGGWFELGKVNAVELLPDQALSFYA